MLPVSPAGTVTKSLEISILYKDFPCLFLVIEKTLVNVLLLPILST
jgi:hypothetical protein